MRVEKALQRSSSQCPREPAVEPGADRTEHLSVRGRQVPNTDDHLRNHGFILKPGNGWRLSEAYDINPVPTGDALKLNITDADNALDLELAREVAGFFRLRLIEADEIIADCKSVVRQWRTLANAIGLGSYEQDYMAPAFAISER